MYVYVYTKLCLVLRKYFKSAVESVLILRDHGKDWESMLDIEQVWKSIFKNS